VLASPWDSMGVWKLADIMKKDWIGKEVLYTLKQDDLGALKLHSVEISCVPHSQDWVMDLLGERDHHKLGIELIGWERYELTFGEEGDYLEVFSNRRGMPRSSFLFCRKDG
jgi:hypothetical protein